MKINLEMIECVLPSLTFNDIQEKKNLIEKLQKIKQLYEKRLKLKKLKNEGQSKILVQNQILEETKRRSRENLNYFEEKFDELCNGLDKKIIFIKKYQKKFDEVQIYIQRESEYFPRWKKIFYDYEIMTFIVENENLLISKNNILKEIKLLSEQFNIVTKENYYYELKRTQEKNEEKKSLKYNDLINLYLSKNKLIQIQINKLKKILYKSSTIYRLKNITSKIESKELTHLNDEDNKTFLNASYLNYSKLTDTFNTNNISKNCAWDISLINKND
jgi:hypothetical protein